MIFIYILILYISFNLIVTVTDVYFVDSLEKITLKYKISSDVAGTTLMALGTSAPELFIALVALFMPGHHADIGIGTIVGSALFNLLVIIGVVCYVSQKKLSWIPILRDLFFYLISIVVLYIVLKDSYITLWEALGLLMLYGGYIFVVLQWKNWLPQHVIEEVDVEKLVEDEVDNKSIWYKLNYYLTYVFNYIMKLTFVSKKNIWLVFSISILWISVLSWVLVQSAIKISEILAIPEAVVALTVLALGTSIPDMLASHIVAVKGKGNMAIANSVGSNIFDVLVGLGLPWIIVIIFSGSGIVTNTADLRESVILLLVSVCVVPIMFVISRWKTNKTIGVIFIGLYVIYLLWQIIPLYL